MQKERKEAYVNQWVTHSETYKRIIVAEATNVGATQLSLIRKSLRGKATILMGKNTMMKKAVLKAQAKNSKISAIVPLLKGNIGLIWTNSDLKEIRDIIDANKNEAPAKPGQISPKVVIIPAQNTGMEPTKTSFFQALNIATKISKGTVEIVNDSKILDIGSKVSQSEAALLTLMGMKPFSYGLVCKTIYDDGVIYDPSVLDTSNDDMLKVLQEGLANVGGLSLGTGYPTSISIASQISNGFKDFLAISIGTNYNFGQSDKLKEFLKDPSKFAKEAPKEEKKEKKEEKKKEEKKEEVKKEEVKKEESDHDMGLSLFGDE